jgi:hypothetical protein
MLDRKVRMDRSWFDVVDWQAARNAASKQSTEVPQIWRGRWQSRVNVQDGKIFGAEEGVGTSEKSLYGGVEFGLERFRLSRARDMPAQMKRVGAATAASISAQFGRVTTGVEAGLATFVSKSAGVPEAAVASASDEAGAPLSYGPPSTEVVRGVDLNLNGFDLTAQQSKDGHWSSRAMAGSDFWKQIMATGESKGDLLNEELGLLRAIYNTDLSDRRGEGEIFVGPSTSASYLQKLKGLVHEEVKAREERLAHFISEDFVPGDAGPLFPASWTCSVENSSIRDRPRQLEVCLFEDAVDLATVKASVEPSFDKCTEDGVRFRVYRWKEFEVRTSQGREDLETIGVVFSVEESMSGSITGLEKVVKITQYVSAGESTVDSSGTDHHHHFRYYVLMETEHGSIILTEGRQDGEVTWEEQPTDLEERRSSSKTLGSVACGQAKITVKDARRYMEAHGAAYTASHGGCKRYAKGLYNWACSQAGKDPRGLERYISAKA